MERQLFALIAVFILVFGLVSQRLRKTILTPPMVFVAFGLLVGSGMLGPLEVPADSEPVLTLAELTLVLVLFTDAARIDLSLLTREYGLALRLLIVGLPLTILVGGLAAHGVLGALSMWEAALLAAILAPTDAALGNAVVGSPEVPARIRQTLNVESGLNDGLVLPVFLFFLSLAGVGEGPETSAFWIRFVVLQLTLGPAVGVAVGFFGGKLVEKATRARWMDHTFQQLSALALSLLAYAVAELLGGNGFIAAFAAGLTIGNASRAVCQCLYDFAEAEGQLLTLLIFLVLGAVMAGPAIAEVGWPVVGYAALSLTAVRMIPVGLSLVGAGLRVESVLFLGWFGPRGIASILFGLVALHEANVPQAATIFAIVVVTVLMSVMAHGVTASPAARWYGRRAQRMKQEPRMQMAEFAPVPEMPLRIPYRGDGDI